MKHLKITVNGTPYDVEVEELGENTVYSAASAAPAPAPVAAPKAPASAEAAPAAKPAAPASAPAGSETVTSPMPGTIVSVSVQPGQSVKKGEVLLVLEAMKMENEIMAPRDAKVAGVLVNKGDSVQTGAPLVSLQ